VGIFLSTNNGVSWTAIDTGLTNKVVESIAVTDSTLFAGTTGGLFRSTDNGLNWTAINSAFTGSSIGAIAAFGSALFAGTSSKGVFRSTDNGVSWTAVDSGLTRLDIYSFAAIGSKLFAGTYNTVFRSTDMGTSWTTASSGLTGSVISLAACNSDLFAGTSDGVFVSSDNGTSWTAVNTGLIDTGINALVICGNNVFAGVGGTGAWIMPLSEIIVHVHPLPEDIPTAYQLDQNYPNPFNPTTEIGFRIVEGGLVTLKVYDLLGREVATLVNQELPPGRYETTFDATKLASGVYFYRLSTRPTSGQQGAFTETRKMVLLR
jgi:ligand-binding sensor domain-containing protein